jgi:TetR/AcrR family transcriptional regulator
MQKSDMDARQRILAAGLKLFANRGYAGTAVNDVTEKAGVTKPTLYYYFESKQGLFQALVDQSMDERFEAMQQAAAQGGTVTKQLEEIMVRLVEFTRRNRDLMRVCFAVAFAAKEENPPGLKYLEKGKRNSEFIRSLMENGIKDGHFKDAFNAQELTAAFWAKMNYCVVSELLGGSGPCRPTVDPRRLLKIFLEGVGELTALARRNAGKPMRTVMPRST